MSAPGRIRTYIPSFKNHYVLNLEGYLVLNAYTIYTNKGVAMSIALLVDTRL